MKQHITHFTKEETIYGPIRSRRLGMTVGVNPLGESKVCSYNCSYCELGETFIRINQIKKEIEFQNPEIIDKQLRKKLLHLEDIQSICVSGNGEPTMYPHFKTLSEMIKTSRDELSSHVKVHLLTNGAHFYQKKIFSALKNYDSVHVKFDAGNDNVLKQANAPLIRTNINKIMSYLQGIDNLVLQSMFFSGPISNTDEGAIEDWIECIGIVKPKVVHIYTIDRKPLNPLLQKVSEKTLDIIAMKLKRKIKIQGLVFP